MLLKIDMSSSEPIYTQIRDQIILGIAAGELRLGESLPSVRQFAEDVGINMMTVSKGYNLLKEEGYIEIDRRNGAKVKKKIASDPVFKEQAQKKLRLLLAELAVHELTPFEIQQIGEEILSEFQTKKERGE